MADRDPGRGVDDAYGLRFNEESLALYQRWADRYEADMVDELGYRYHHEVARLYAEGGGEDDAPVLDLGCGTGLLGEALAARGDWPVDGVDLSEAMLAMAARKGIYQRLIAADLNRPIEPEGAAWGGLVSAGTFTRGHLGPAVIESLLDALSPGALCCLGINAVHYAEADFGALFASLYREALISKPQLHAVDIYGRRDHARGRDQATVVRFRCVGARRD